MKSKALIASVLFISTNVNADVISYDEIVDGDLDARLWNPTYLGLTDIGTNVISGSAVWDIPLDIIDYDSFYFTVASGQRVSSIRTSYVSGNWRVLMGLEQDHGNFIFSDLAYFNLGQFERESSYSSSDVLSGADILASSDLSPLEAGDYKIVMGGFESYAETSFIDYTWEIEVTAVPVPSAIWFFGTGLITLIGLAKRVPFNSVRLDLN